MAKGSIRTRRSIRSHPAEGLASLECRKGSPFWVDILIFNPNPVLERAFTWKFPIEKERMAMKKIRVLIAEDHTIVRQGLSALLRATPEMEVVGEASDGLEAVDMAKRLIPDVVLMDIAMRNLNGIEATRKIKKLF